MYENTDEDRNDIALSKPRFSAKDEIAFLQEQIADLERKIENLEKQPKPTAKTTSKESETLPVKGTVLTFRPYKLKTFGFQLVSKEKWNRTYQELFVQGVGDLLSMKHGKTYFNYALNGNLTPFEYRITVFEDVLADAMEACETAFTKTEERISADRIIRRNPSRLM